MLHVHLCVLLMLEIEDIVGLAEIKTTSAPVQLRTSSQPRAPAENAARLVPSLFSTTSPSMRSPLITWLSMKAPMLTPACSDASSFVCCM
jgi:hypothetical protein